MKSSPFKCGLFWISLSVVAVAGWLWNGRMARRHELRMAKQEQRASQRASALLAQAFYADNFLTFSAVSQSSARMGDKEISSSARVVHAPRQLSIIYFKGDYAGLHSGYNEHWAWRQVSANQPMIPYAEMERPATDLVARRFALLLKNYSAECQGMERVSGREAEVVQVRPISPAPGAKGPGKKLWIDAENGLTLRQQTFNYQMTPVMESVLSDVNLAPEITSETFVPPSKLQQAARQSPSMVHDAVSDSQRIAALAGVYPPRPDTKALPVGFEFDSVGTHRCNDEHEGKKAVCYAALARYTDGLNTMTIFAFKPGCDQIAPVKKKGHETTMNKMPETPSQSGLNPATNTPDDAHTCDFGTGTLVIRETPEGNLIAVADLPSPVLNRVLEATTIHLFSAAKK